MLSIDEVSCRLRLIKVSGNSDPNQRYVMDLFALFVRGRQPPRINRGAGCRVAQPRQCPNQLDPKMDVHQQEVL